VEYANANYASSISFLKTALEANSYEPSADAFSYLLLGNAEGRLGSRSSLSKARNAYERSLGAVSNYPRAKLGLAEIEYQQVAKSCAGGLNKSQRKILAAAYNKYSSVYGLSKSSAVPDVDVRAKYGMGRIRVCKFLAGDETQFPPAMEDLRLVTSRYDAFPERIWLRGVASAAFGLMGAMLVQENRTNEAIESYQQASRIAVDRGQVKLFQCILDNLNGGNSNCAAINS